MHIYDTCYDTSHAVNFFDISQISNLYKVVCTNFSADFWTFHNFLTAISRKLWRHLATEMQTI